MSKNNEGKIRASSAKIAYYVQKMCKNDEDVRKVIFVIRSQFDKKDVREFAKKYRYCFNDDSVRHVANMIAQISPKKLDKAMNQLLDQ